MVVVASQCLLVDALSADSARRLVAALGSVRAALASDGGDDGVVAIEFDRENEGWLDGVLGGLQTWLAGSAQETCRVHLDGRSYVLERAAP